MSCREVSLYIHIPFCLSKCDYCDFFSIAAGNKSKADAVPPEYVDSLCNEITYRLKQYGDCVVKTIYIGGGTPSLLSFDEISKIAKTIKKAGLTRNYEFTFEVNPDDIDKALLSELESCGINRISCGIQSFCDKALKNVHRRAGRDTVFSAIQLLLNEWNKNLSVDLICGLPYETEESLLNALTFLVNNNIAHISFYSLCVEEETPLGKAIINHSQKYDEDFSDELWLKGRDFLLSKGYIQYEVSNFCLPGHECIHNMAYWTRKDYIGCGSGGTGTIYNNNGEGVRYTNIKNPEEYTKFWQKTSQEYNNIPQTVEKIRQNTAEFEYFMMGLRTTRGVSPHEFEAFFGKKLPQNVLKLLENECVKTNEGFYYLDKERLLFLNSFLQRLGTEL